MTKETFSLASIGLSSHEQQILRCLCRLSSSRTRCYKTVSASGPEAPEILIVDGDDPNVLAQWQDLMQERVRTGKLELPTVLVSRSDPSDERLHHARRPIVAVRLLRTLDTVSPPAQIRNERPAIQAPSRSVGDAQVRPTTDPPKASGGALMPIAHALVVDDSLPVRRQLELELERHGVHATFAQTGEEAVDLIKRERFDLVFLDIVLPGISGYQVCKSIKRDKSRKHIPVIMLTGKSSPFDHVKGALAGTDSYLTKPVKQSTFDATVSRFLAKLVPSDAGALSA